MCELTGKNGKSQDVLEYTAYTHCADYTPECLLNAIQCELTHCEMCCTPNKLFDKMFIYSIRVSEQSQPWEKSVEI